LLQHDATPERLARALLDWLDAPARIAAVQEKFTLLHHRLRRDTATLATHAIEKVLQG
jgi:lipid-A-disaccharide synthase